jgi:hypothetical protein
MRCFAFVVATLAAATLGLPAQASSAEASSATASAADSPRTTDELVQLYATTTGYGALTGLWLAELAGARAAHRFLPAVGLAALGFGATAWLDGRGTLTLGLPQAIVTDAVVGFEIGLAWTLHFRSTADAGESPSAGRELTLVWGGATLGAGIGVLRYALSPSEPGRAAFTGTASLWSGALAGLTAGALTASPARRDENATRALALGLEAGVVLASLSGRWLQPSLGWVRALDAGALLGAALAGGSYLLVTGSALDSRGTLAAGALGMTAGLAAAAFLAPALGWPRHASFAVGPNFGLGPGTFGASARGQW